MSKTKRKQRERLGYNPKRVTLKLMFNYQTHLFAQAQNIGKNMVLTEIEKRNSLNDILEFMQRISKQLINRGCLVNPNNHL